MTDQNGMPILPGGELPPELAAAAAAAVPLGGLTPAQHVAAVEHIYRKFFLGLEADGQGGAAICFLIPNGGGDQELFKFMAQPQTIAGLRQLLDRIDSLPIPPTAPDAGEQPAPAQPSPQVE